MGQLDNLNTSQIGDIFRRLRALETAAAATNTAIGRSGLLVYDGGVITVENGGLDVTGTATISGTLTGDGTFTWSGPFNQSGTSTFTGTTNLNGPTDITGDLDVTGPTTITGTLSVEGATTLNNTLTVSTGQIVAGGMTIDPSTAGGSVQFAGGSFVGESLGSLIASASNFIILNTDTRVNGDLSAPSLPTTTNAPNVYIDPSTGNFYRCV